MAPSIPAVCGVRWWPLAYSSCNTVLPSNAVHSCWTSCVRVEVVNPNACQCHGCGGYEADLRPKLATGEDMQRFQSWVVLRQSLHYVSDASTALATPCHLFSMRSDVARTNTSADNAEITICSDDAGLLRPYDVNWVKLAPRMQLCKHMSACNCGHHGQSRVLPS